MDVQAGGLPIGELPEGSVVVEAIAVLLVVLPDGRAAYFTQKSESLALVHAWGMVKYAEQQIDTALKQDPPVPPR